MKEIYINATNTNTIITLVENAKVIEKYEENLDKEII